MFLTPKPPEISIKVLALWDNHDALSCINSLKYLGLTKEFGNLYYKGFTDCTRYWCNQGTITIYDRFIDVSGSRRFRKEMYFAINRYQNNTSTKKHLTYLKKIRINTLIQQAKGIPMKTTIFHYVAQNQFYKLALTSKGFDKLDPTKSHTIKKESFDASVMAECNEQFGIPDQIIIANYSHKFSNGKFEGKESFKAELFTLMWTKLDADGKEIQHRDGGEIAEFRMHNVTTDHENDVMVSYTLDNYEAFWKKDGKSFRPAGPCEIHGLADIKVYVTDDLLMDMDHIIGKGWTPEKLSEKNIKSWSFDSGLKTYNGVKVLEMDPRYFEAVQSLACVWEMPTGESPSPQALHNAIHYHKLPINIFQSGPTAFPSEDEETFFYVTVGNDDGTLLVDFE